MIWFITGLALALFPIVLALSRYGGTPAEAMERFWAEASLEQIFQLSVCVRFGVVTMCWGLFKILVLG